MITLYICKSSPSHKPPPTPPLYPLIELGQAGGVEPLMPLRALKTLREAPRSVASVLFSAASDPMVGAPCGGSGAGQVVQVKSSDGGPRPCQPQ
jgi:hypothetical protein